jgi:hypothetical protein
MVGVILPPTLLAVATISTRRPGIDVLAAAAVIIAALVAAAYVVIINSQNGTIAVWFLGGLTIAGASAAYGAVRSPPAGTIALSASGALLLVLGVLAILSIGLPLLIAGVLTLLAAARSRRSATRVDPADNNPPGTPARE